jgi:hypothetical protein
VDAAEDAAAVSRGSEEAEDRRFPAGPPAARAGRQPRSARRRRAGRGDAGPEDACATTTCPRPCSAAAKHRQQPSNAGGAPTRRPSARR